MVKVFAKKLATGSLLRIECGPDSINFSVYVGGIYHLPEYFNEFVYETVAAKFTPLSPDELKKFLADYEQDVDNLFARLEEL